MSRLPQAFHRSRCRRRSDDRGDRFEGFLAEEGDSLFRLAVVLSTDVGTGEDLYQETLERVARRWETIENPAAWSRRVMHNLAVDRIRARRGRPPLAASGEGSGPPDPRAAARLEAVELRPALFEALATLSDTQRLVVALRFLEDRSESDVAELLGVPLGTVKSTASRAVRRLRRHQSLAHLFAAHGSPHDRATG